MNPVNTILKAIREHATFLANEFRALRNDIRENGKKVNLSLDAETIAKLNEGDTRKFAQMLRGLENVSSNQKLSNAELVTALTKLRTAVEGSNNADIVAALKGLEQTVVKTAPKDLEIDLSGLKDLALGLKDVQAAVLNSGKATQEAMGMVAAQVAELAGKPMPEFPGEFKMQRDQFAQLSRGLGGSSIKPATQVTMANVSLSSADTEYSYTFPANTVGFDVKLRGQGTLLLYAWETGKLPTSGDSSAYATVPQNGLQSQDNVEWSGKTIYLQTGSTSQVAEIVTYQL